MINHKTAPTSVFLRVGLGLTAMATVLLELLLTRIFSAAAGYHFAFMIVSMTMFGMTLGALVVLVRRIENAEVAKQILVTNSCLFAGSTILAFVIHNLFSLPIEHISSQLWAEFSFMLFSIPFYFSGVCVSICLSQFQDIGKLYSADLIGAAIGCPILVLGLSLTDSQNMLSLGAMIAALGALFFIASLKQAINFKNYIYACLVFILCLFGFLLPRPAIEIKGFNGPIEYVKWSPIGRVVVAPESGSSPSLWAKAAIAHPMAIAQKGIWIDSGAFTVMTSGTATAGQVQPIKQDLTALGNFLRPANSLFVIGVGGARDVLTGLLYDQKRIDGVEVNAAIVDMLKHKYADFVDCLTEKPGVNIINDEARNWLARSGRQYGLIQCSMVDTWSASSSGAFMLTETVLYTKEAFELYLKHLEPNGILSVLRWGDEHESAQIMRMLRLAKNALLKRGITDISKHIILVTALFPDNVHSIGNMLVSLEPFSNEDIDKVKHMCAANGYHLMLVPGVVARAPFASLFENENSISARIPNDDCPFFFTPADPENSKSSLSLGEPAQEQGLVLLKNTFMLVLLLVIFTLVIPVWTKYRPQFGSLQDILSSAGFFGCLGLAFMLVEVGQIERLTVLLGNPIYGLSVVLFSILLSSGIGSYVISMLLKKGTESLVLLKTGLILSAVLTIFSAFLSAWAVSGLEVASTAARIIVAIVLVAAPAFFMGWGFPTGMIVFMKKNQGSAPWFWAVNGAMSVLGSILAAIFSVMLGITNTLLIGAAFYIIAWAVMRLRYGTSVNADA